MLLTPNSWGTELHEFNPNHEPGGSAIGGRFAATKGAPDRGGGSYTRPVPIKTRDIDEALRLVAKGQVVELADTQAVHTLLGKLAGIANEAKRLGKDAPTYDLCKVTVAGTNLFCHDRIRTAEHPDGLPRITMPQFKGWAVPGTEADKLPKKAPHGRIDAEAAFVAHLESLGVKTSTGTEAASTLKATQAELIGANVAGMMTTPGFDPKKGALFISRDNYVVDGHHRWAAVVGLDAADGKLGDIRMNVVRIDAPITEILLLARKWTKAFGVRTEAGK